jgi:hypothetical protein
MRLIRSLAAGDTPLNSLRGNRTLPRAGRERAAAATTPRLLISRELGVSLSVGWAGTKRKEGAATAKAHSTPRAEALRTDVECLVHRLTLVPVAQDV